MSNHTLYSMILIYFWSYCKSLSESLHFLERGYSTDFSNLQSFNEYLFHLDDTLPLMTNLDDFAQKKQQDIQPIGGSENFLFTTVMVHGSEFLVKVDKSLSSISFIQQYGTSMYSKSLFLTTPYPLQLEKVFLSSMDTLFVQMQGI